MDRLIIILVIAVAAAALATIATSRMILASAVLRETPLLASKGMDGRDLSARRVQE